MTEKYKTTKKEIGVIADKDKSKKYKIILKGEELNIDKDKYKNDEEVTINVTVQEMDKDGNPVTGKNAENKQLKGKVKTGIFYDSVEILKDKASNGLYDLDEGFHAPVEGWRAMFHVSYSVGGVLLIGLIAWWWFASRKEDKEEESL